MLCKNPYVKNRQVFRCGRCLPCRVNKRREWTHRILLEAGMHEQNTFVTLTYDDDNIPKGGSLVPEHLQKFLKRLRRKVPQKLRFYAVGEYGDDSWRPHYHLALFNYPNCEYGRTRPRENCCSSCDTVRAAWGKGNIYLGDLERKSAQYVCKYVTKRFTNPDDPRLEGRHPEFARMSNRPGIGGDVADEIASALLAYPLPADVPTHLRHGEKKLPLGVYIRRRIRERIGRDVKTPKKILEEIQQKMSPLRELAEAAPKGISKDFVMGSLYREVIEGQLRNTEARERRNRKKAPI